MTTLFPSWVRVSFDYQEIIVDDDLYTMELVDLPTDEGKVAYWQIKLRDEGDVLMQSQFELILKEQFQNWIDELREDRAWAAHLATDYERNLAALRAEAEWDMLYYASHQFEYQYDDEGIIEDAGYYDESDNTDYEAGLDIIQGI